MSVAAAHAPPFPPPRLGGKGWGQELQGNRTVERDLVGEVDDAHATAGDLALQV